MDSTDYNSLQASFQPIGGGFASSSLNYGYDMYNDLRCAFILLIFMSIICMNLVDISFWKHKKVR